MSRLEHHVDYTRDIELVRSLTTAAKVRDIVRSPARLIEGGLSPGILRGLASVLGGSSDNSATHMTLALAWRMRYGVEASRSSSPLIRSLWEGSTDSIGTLSAYGSHYEYRSVFGIPVAEQPNYPSGWIQSPATDAQIFERARGHDWMFERGDEGRVSMLPDSDLPAAAVLDKRTRALIDDIKSIPGCRAHLLWGPPRAGKSIAAKQVAREIGGSWARICGSVCVAPEVWRALDVLRPSALIVDDIDVSAGQESPLMLGLERAREWARVILSTANVVPSTRPGTRDDSVLRGAVLGRASDGALIEYRTLSDEVRLAIAPDVPPELETSDLLAQYQVELQRRAKARGTVTQSDVDELRNLQALVGDR